MSNKRVAALYILEKNSNKVAILQEQYREAGIKDLWRTWVSRPITSLIKRAPEFLDGPVDDVVDDIFRDIAPLISEEVQKQVIQIKLEEFESGALAGAKQSLDGRYPEEESKDYFPKYNCSGDCDWEAQGYLAGYRDPSIISFKGLKDKGLKKKVLRAIYEQEEDDLSENVIFDKLWGIWETINPVNLVKMTIEMVKQHGWKIGIGIALVQAIETFVIPAIVGALGFGPGAIAISSQLPITEIVLPIAAAKLGIEVGDPPVITDDVDDWMVENPNLKLSSSEIEDKFLDLVQSGNKFDKILSRNMIMASSKTVVAKYMKSANKVRKIINLIEKGGDFAEQAKLLGQTLWDAGQISKKEWHQIQLALLGLRLEEAELDYDDTHGYLDVKFWKLHYDDLSFHIPMVLEYSPINNSEMEVFLSADFDRDLHYNRLRDRAFESGSTTDYSWLSRASVKSVLRFKVTDDNLDIEDAINKERKKLEEVFETKALTILFRNVSELYFSYSE